MEKYLDYTKVSFEDICGGKIKDKQDYDLTYGKSRYLRTSYFGEDGSVEHITTGKVSESKSIKEKSEIIVDVKFQEHVGAGEVSIKD